MNRLSAIKRQHDNDQKLFNMLENYVINECEEEIYGAVLPKRKMRDHLDPLEITSEAFQNEHGMSKHAFRHLLDVLNPQLESVLSNKPSTLPPALKLSAFLRFLRTNSFQRVVGSDKSLKISQSVVCNEVNGVAKILAQKQSQFVTFPDKKESLYIATQFQKMTGFPPVISGIIDGTHIQIQKPCTKNPKPERFFNRKGYYSINALVVADHTMKIRYFSARHAGSSHDSRIFNESCLKSKLMQEYNENRPLALLGDEGFGCDLVMLTPFRQCQIANEESEEKKQKMIAFNDLHRRTRILIENVFGILKKRWPALLYKLRCNKLSHVQNLIASAVVLHNYLLEIKDPISIVESKISEEEYETLSQNSNMNNAASNLRQKFDFRNYIVQKYF